MGFWRRSMPLFACDQKSDRGTLLDVAADGGARPVGLAHKFDGFAGVGGRISQRDPRRGRGDPDEAVSVKIVELSHLSFRPLGPARALSLK